MYNKTFTPIRFNNYKRDELVEQKNVAMENNY